MKSVVSQGNGARSEGSWETCQSVRWVHNTQLFQQPQVQPVVFVPNTSQSLLQLIAINYKMSVNGFTTNHNQSQPVKIISLLLKYDIHMDTHSVVYAESETS